MMALVGYPLVIESHLTLAEQSWWWTVGYGLLMALVAACAVLLVEDGRQLWCRRLAGNACRLWCRRLACNACRRDARTTTARNEKLTLRPAPAVAGPGAGAVEPVAGRHHAHLDRHRLGAAAVGDPAGALPAVVRAGLRPAADPAAPVDAVGPGRASGRRWRPRSSWSGVSSSQLAMVAFLHLAAVLRHGHGVPRRTGGRPARKPPPDRVLPVDVGRRGGGRAVQRPGRAAVFQACWSIR